MEKVLTQFEIVKMAAKAGAEAALAKMLKETAKERQCLKDNRLKNTKLLLKHFRELKEHCANSVFEASQLNEDAIDILNFMYDPQNKSEQVIESIKGSAMKTQIIMCHIESMLNIYEKLCRQSKEPESLRHFSVLHDLYISKEQLTPCDIASKHGIAERTVYRDIDDASEKVSALIFGVDWLISSSNINAVDP